ncbi:MAG: hypothetical protein AB8B49_00310 [Nitratireductor sp.]
MYTNSNVWIAIILAGIAGCIMTAIFAKAIKGIDISAIAGNWKKHLWSIIFAIPIPFLFSLDVSWGIFIAFAWLVLAPTIATKLYFAKDIPLSSMTLNAFHCGYALMALLVFVWVTRYLAIMMS